jgi:hypothetical protein
MPGWVNSIDIAMEEGLKNDLMIMRPFKSLFILLKSLKSAFNAVK